MIYPTITLDKNMDSAVIDMIDTVFDEGSFFSMKNETVGKTFDLFITLIIAFINQYDCGFDDGYEIGYEDAEEDLSDSDIIE